LFPKFSVLRTPVDGRDGTSIEDKRVIHGHVVGLTAPHSRILRLLTYPR